MKFFGLLHPPMVVALELLPKRFEKWLNAVGAWQVILMSVFFEEAAIIICKQYLRII